MSSLDTSRGCLHYLRNPGVGGSGPEEQGADLSSVGRNLSLQGTQQETM